MVKSGDTTQVKEILYDNFNQSEELLKQCKHDYNHLSYLYNKPDFDKSIIDNRYVVY